MYLPIALDEQRRIIGYLDDLQAEVNGLREGVVHVDGIHFG